MMKGQGKGKGQAKIRASSAAGLGQQPSGYPHYARNALPQRQIFSAQPLTRCNLAALPNGQLVLLDNRFDAADLHQAAPVGCHFDASMGLTRSDPRDWFDRDLQRVPIGSPVGLDLGTPAMRVQGNPQNCGQPRPSSRRAVSRPNKGRLLLTASGLADSIAVATSSEEKLVLMTLDERRVTYNLYSKEVERLCGENHRAAQELKTAAEVIDFLRKEADDSIALTQRRANELCALAAKLESEVKNLHDQASSSQETTPSATASSFQETTSSAPAST